jgi:Alpha/beta hydrolase of unknown function (DUF900)
MNSRIKYYSSDHLALVLVTVLVSLFLIHMSIYPKSSYAQLRLINPATAPKIPEVSIHSPIKPEMPVILVSTNGSTGAYSSYPGDLLKLYSACPKEVAILVHGKNPIPESTREEFDRAAMSIESNHYYIPVIGFQWPSTINVPESAVNANKSGSGLAQFLTDFKSHCESTRIRLVAHSMGTMVLNSTMNILNSNKEWNASRYKIESVHLLGSSLEQKTPDIKNAFGKFVQKFVGQLYNLYSPNDIVLGFSLSSIHFLGSEGAPRGITTPTNYKDTNVATEILANYDANGDGDCDYIICPKLIGQNHFGYWGFRDKRMHFLDDGAMDIVVCDWRKCSDLYKIDRTREIIASGPVYEANISKSIGNISNASIIQR